MSLTEILDVALRDSYDDESMIENIIWDVIIQRAKRHPEEAKSFFSGIVGFEEHLPLHAVVTLNPPLEAVEALLQAHPEALGVRCRPRRSIVCMRPPASVLKFACMFECSLDVISFLANKEKSLGFNCDYYKIGWVIEEELSSDIVRVLLQTYAEEVAQQYAPVVEVFQGNCEYEVLRLLLMAFDHKSVDLESLERSGVMFHPLNAMLRHLLAHMQEGDYPTRGFLDSVRKIKEKSPNLFRQQDCKGRLPLEVLIQTKVCRRDIGVQDWESFQIELVETLVLEDPQSVAIRNVNGQLPLHLAIQNGWPAIAIFEANPDAVNVRDVKTGLYPFQQAAAAACDTLEDIQGKNEREDISLAEILRSSVDLSYRLLRENPMLVVARLESK